ncbi:MAG TPA: glycosyltransferase family 39 protein [Candidatus Portnoybacteria bacterium]|nr:glycosyltransferase family 39 protein [Candidatus Portnoybacteria bacterium]
MNLFKSLVKQKALFFLLVILAVAAFFRFYDLAGIPPGLYPDVAINGNDAINALKNHDFKLFYPENNGREGLFINLIAFSFWLFGISVWSIKIVPAIFGLLTVLGIYFLAKQLFCYLGSRHSQAIGLLAAFFLSISFWHVNFSRLGFRAIMVPFFLVWSFYFLYRGLNVGEKMASRNLKAAGLFILAGLFFGLGFHTYIAFRIAPVILLVPIIFSFVYFWPKLKNFWKERASVWHFIKSSYLRDTLWLWDVFFLFTILAALPMALYFWQHPNDFMSRTGQVSVLASANPVKELAISTIKSLGMFNVVGDCNWRHNYACQPALFWPIGILFLIGLAITLIKIFRPANYKKKEHFAALETHWLLVVWFGAMLLPEIMTTEGLPHSLRSIGAIPPVFIWVALGAWWLTKKVKALLVQKESRAEKIGLIVIAFIFLLMFALAEFNRYFIDWGAKAEVSDSFTQRLVNEGKYLESLPADTQKIVLANENGVAVPYPDGLPMPVQTILFFNHDTPNLFYYIKDTNSKKSSYKTLRVQGPLVIMPLKPDEQIFKDLSRLIPDGFVEKINNFEAFKVNF